MMHLETPRFPLLRPCLRQASCGNRVVRTSKKALLIASILGFSAAWSPASAGMITFDFNSLSDNANNSAVQTYMNGVLAPYSASVAVSGALADNNYTADNHLVGPKNGSVTPLALWNTDGSVTGNSDTTKWHIGTRDTYIMNVSGITTIAMDFTGIDIDGVTFDLQIFPDGTCPNASSTSSSQNKGCTSTANINWPDFKFVVEGSEVEAWDGVLPNTLGTYKYSPAKSTNGGETAPQLLTTSGYIDLSGLNALSLDFVDWPAHIGVDNLVIYTREPPDETEVPEPASILTFGSGLLIALGLRRRKARVRKTAGSRP